MILSLGSKLFKITDKQWKEYLIGAVDADKADVIEADLKKAGAEEFSTAVVDLNGSPNFARLIASALKPRKQTKPRAKRAEKKKK